MVDVSTGAAFRATREDARLSQTQLAAIFGVSPLTVAHIEQRELVAEKYQRWFNAYLEGASSHFYAPTFQPVTPYYAADAPFALPARVDAAIAPNLALNHGLCRWRLVVVGDKHPAYRHTLATFWSREHASRFLATLD